MSYEEKMEREEKGRMERERGKMEEVKGGDTLLLQNYRQFKIF